MAGISLNGLVSTLAACAGCPLPVVRGVRCVIIRAMEDTDQAPMIAIAMMAARADGRVDSVEQRAVDAVVARTGSPDVTGLAQQVAAGQLRIPDLASRLSDDEARRAAWEGALAIVNADGPANTAEQAFLSELRAAPGFSDADVAESSRTASALARTPLAAGALSAAPLDELILQQAILTGALEVLPDRLANLAILPLQLRLVYQIGQRREQKLDANQVEDRAATLGLGAAAQGVEGVAMKLIGGLGGPLGRNLRRGYGVATGAVTFSATYASAMWRSSTTRRAGDSTAPTCESCSSASRRKRSTPGCEERIERQASTLNLQSLLQGFRNG